VRTAEHGEPADGRPGALSLYQEQRTKLLDMADDIQAFMRSNAASLQDEELTDAP